MKARQNQAEELKLGDAVGALLDECRMILPGIQALFGFQLIAVFNSGFSEKLSTGEQYLHLAALGFGMDFYLIARIILQDAGTSLVLAVLLVVVFGMLWFLLPRLRSLRNMTGIEE